MKELLPSLSNAGLIGKAVLQKIIPNIVGAILLLFVGIWLTRLIRKIIKKMMIKREVDITVQVFVNQLLRWILYIILFLTIIQILGIPTSSFLGALTASAVAIGLALQGSLSNFAGGIMLLLLKPFKIGDSIEAKGQAGVVQKIGIFYTTLTKASNEVVVIPNGPLFADSIINYSVQEKRRAKISVKISYHSDMNKVRQTMLNIADNCSLALKDPKPMVYVEELTDNSVVISLRVWALTENYGEMYHYLLENIKLEFGKEKIEISPSQKEISTIDK